MNKDLEEFARSRILVGLNKLPETNQMLFKRMYSHNNLDASIKDVVASMPCEKLDWAMQQVSRTLEDKNDL